MDLPALFNDPLFLICAVPAVLLVGISKGGFAGGFGMLGVPIMALAISPVTAAAIMLPILITMDMIGIAAYRKHWHVKIALGLIGPATLGIGAGWLFAGQVNDDYVRLLLGFIALVFSVNFLVQRMRHGAITARPASPARAGFWGSIAGFTSFVAHAGGPPFQVYALPLNLGKTQYVATSVLFFAMINLIKLPPYAFLGQLDGSNLLTSLALLPLAPLGMYAGIWLHKKVPEGPFFLLTYIGLALAGTKLLWDGFSAVI